MSSQRGGGSQGRDRPLKAGFHGGGFAILRHDTQDLFGPEQLLDGNAEGLARHFVERSEPAFAHLLGTAGRIERDDEVRFFCFEIGGRIVEGEVTIFADTDKGEIDAGGGDFAVYCG